MELDKAARDSVEPSRLMLPIRLVHKVSYVLRILCPRTEVLAIRVGNDEAAYKYDGAACTKAKGIEARDFICADGNDG